MAGTNEILPFALGGAANLTPQTDYAALTARTSGFQAGVAQSAQINKVLRQAAFMARVLSQWAIDNTGGSILDNGDEANAKALLSSAVLAVVTALLTSNNYATNPALNAAVAALNAEINAEAALRAQADAAENSTRTAADTAEATARYNADVAKSNTRYAQDQAIIALLGGYMARGTTQGNFARFVSLPSVTSVQRVDLTVTLTAAATVHVTGSVNVSIGLQAIGAYLNLYSDFVLITTESTQGSMSNSFTIAMAAGAHTLTLFYVPTTAAPLAQVGLNLSYLAVEV